MDRLVELIDEISEFRRFKADMVVALYSGDYGRKVVDYNDPDLSCIFDKICEIIKKNRELKEKLERILQEK